MFDSILNDLRKDDQVSLNDLRMATMLILEAKIKLLTETQSIEQLLVGKGIFSSEELESMRKIVDTNSPTIRKLKSELNTINEAYDEMEAMDRDLDKFEALFKKSLNDPKSLTPEERSYVDDVLKRSGEELKHRLK